MDPNGPDASDNGRILKPLSFSVNDGFVVLMPLLRCAPGCCSESTQRQGERFGRAVDRSGQVAAAIPQVID